MARWSKVWVWARVGVLLCEWEMGVGQGEGVDRAKSEGECSGCS